MLGRNLGGICKGISTARFKMNNGSSDIHVVRIEYSGEWLELKKTEKKKWKLRSSPPPPYPSSSRCFAPIGDLGDEVAEALQCLQ